MRIYVNIYRDIYTYMYMYMYKYIHVYTFIYTHMYIYIHMYICILVYWNFCLRIFVYTNMHKRKYASQVVPPASLATYASFTYAETEREREEGRLTERETHTQTETETETKRDPYMDLPQQILGTLVGRVLSTRLDMHTLTWINK